MKKFLFGAFMLAIGSAAFTSCFNDNDSEYAEATIPYFALCDSIMYTDINDTVYDAMIRQSFDNLKLTGTNSIFEESVRLNVGITAEAVLLCDQQAVKTYEKTLNGFNLADIREEIYDKNKDSQGWTSEDDITLDTFYAKITLHGMHFNTHVTVQTYNKQF